MQSNTRVIQGLLQKIQSPLSQIRNRAVATLYTKVSAKIIDQNDLIKSKVLPGVLMNWINQTTPTHKECLYKVLSVLHRYTFCQDGIELLVEYEGLQFLQELRKFLLSNEMNVDQHVDIIKKIIKQILPLQNKKSKRRQIDNQQSLCGDKQNDKMNNGLNQQQEQQQSNQDVKISTSSHNQNKQKKLKKQGLKQQKSSKQPKKQQNNIISFYCLNDNLPKAIDQKLYALLIQLKHGKKQTVLQTLIKIQQIIDFWGSNYFKYKEDLVRELIIVIEGKIFSQIAIRILSTILKQLLQIQDDLGIHFQDNLNNLKRKYHKTLKISDKNNSKPVIQKISIEINFQIFQDNPFSYKILETMICKNRSLTLSFQVIQYLIEAIQKFSYSATFLTQFLRKIQNNKKWMNQKFSINKFYQEQVLRMINHGCYIQSQIYLQVMNQLIKLFPDKSLEQLSIKIPSLQAQLQQRQIQQSFDILNKILFKRFIKSKF